MGDFVTKAEVDRIRTHFETYIRDSDWEQTDNRGEPLSGRYDATTFREVSTRYVDRLLRFIEVQGWVADIEK